MQTSTNSASTSTNSTDSSADTSANTSVNTKESYHNSYRSALEDRYASKEMRSLFSAKHKHTCWRHLWIALAEAEMSLGLPITQNQIDEMRSQVSNINFSAAEKYENQMQHDVMAHIHAYGDLCPNAKPIIHLGATSCLITDNTDVLIMRDALVLIQTQLIKLIKHMTHAAEQYKDIACLSFTHLQPAQPTTIGKRIAMWLQDFMLDLEDLKYRLTNLRILGIKGATGTQASFSNLFEGDLDKVVELEKIISKKLGFENKVFPITGQTYTRKQDIQILDLLSSIAVSAHKMATDIRILAHRKEIEEPFGKTQVGSSAMPYKRNPMRCERICALSRYIISLAENPKYTAATQWLERTLDDSANRRLCIPEAFLATDAILQLLINVTNGLVVYPMVANKNLSEELPFLATEQILMASVKKGKDRQTVHESIRQHCIEVSECIKLYGQKNDLINRLVLDPNIPLDNKEIMQLLDISNFIGRAPQQVMEIVKEAKKIT